MGTPELGPNNLVAGCVPKNRAWPDALTLLPPDLDALEDDGCLWRALLRVIARRF